LTVLIAKTKQGLTLIRLANEQLVVHIDERFGGEITQIEFCGMKLLAYYDWDSPANLAQDTRFSAERQEWLSNYRGGWQFLVPNAGSECEVEGVKHPFHGEWSRTEVSIGECSEKSVQMRATLSGSIFVERVVSLESNPVRVKLTTTLQNLSDEPTSFIWGEHPAFIAQPGDRIDLPVTSVLDTDGISLGTWPISSCNHPLDVVGSESPNESVHFVTNLSNGWAALRRSDIGVALAWDVRDFPHVWLWRENGTKGFPFFGRASLIAIEPASSWPGTGLGEACKRGQAFSLSSHESRSTVVALVPFTTTTFPVRNVAVSGQIDFET